ncbi:MAG: hypothetical protein JWO65_221 [Sphingomonas bacterium]|jgi:peptidoglycan/LPS O-acetylase OafA/YrhL|nr:hypothetical protein [Sphingomonas bacterium]
MKSSTGQHWIALDHIRAFAAFCVFTGHFLHGFSGLPVPIAGAPAIFPFAILDEGETGVSLFMALSGYLFAKLLDGKEVRYSAFFWNRFLRLAPLMLLILVVVDVQRAWNGEATSPWPYVRELLRGFVTSNPPLPHGHWSIVVETQFYVLIPMLMIAVRKWPSAPLWLVGTAITLRAALYLHGNDMAFLGYWTIIGRIDQFLLGIFAFRYRSVVCKRHGVAAAVAIGFALLYYGFDLAGGLSHFADDPVRQPLWILMPTIEGAAYATLIAYYDGSFAPSARGISGFVAKAGAYSYSIYLLHFFVVFHASYLIHTDIMDISNLYVACAWSMLCFAMMVPIGWLSFRCIEEPFLKMRLPYIKGPIPAPAAASAQDFVVTILPA